MKEPRLKIVIDKGPSAGIELVLAERTFSVGRDPNADLPLLGDEFVSVHHAKIVSTEDGAVLHNLSANGTLINGRPVRDVELASGDRISIGSLHLLSVRAHVPASRSTVRQPAVEHAAPTSSRVSELSQMASASDAASAKVRMPVWLMAYLGLMAIAFVFFAIVQLRDAGAPGVKQIQAQEEQYATARKLAKTDTERVGKLLVMAEIFERRGDPRSAYEAYRETLGVRQPIDPQSPAYRYAASRIAALGAK